jgi:hypothetical protein
MTQGAAITRQAPVVDREGNRLRSPKEAYMTYSPMAGALVALAAISAAPLYMSAIAAPTECQGISAEKASRLNDKFRGNGTVAPADGDVTIQTPCGAVVCNAGRGFARPKDTRVDGANIGNPGGRKCTWASK